MVPRTIYILAVVLLASSVVSAQEITGSSFTQLEIELKNEQGGWNGNKEKLSKVFDAERQRLGDAFEAELLKWLGKDPEKHYWISYFVENDSYLHGSRRLPHLSLLIKEQGLSVVRGRNDKDSRHYAVGLSVTAAILSSELGLRELAWSHKREAERLLAQHPDLDASFPALSEAERRRYDEIDPVIRRGVVTQLETGEAPNKVAGDNPTIKDLPRAPISGGIVNGRALKLPKPKYPPEAYLAGASGQVGVQVVIDETGKVISARAVSGHPLLHEVCEEAARKAQFEVTKLEGEPVKITGVIVYNFVR